MIGIKRYKKYNKFIFRKLNLYKISSNNLTKNPKLSSHFNKN